MLPHDRPFHVTRVAEMAFDSRSEIAELKELLLRERRPVAVRRRHVDFPNPPTTIEQSLPRLVPEDLVSELPGDLVDARADRIRAALSFSQ